ncbi:MAG: Rieske (2Fe-2S) protein [Pseudomonadota bacterium]
MAGAVQPRIAELSDAESALARARPNNIDYRDRDRLHYLGQYRREIPVSLTRMMENAYDWEHLPYVHASSFADITLIDQGNWGWRARLDLPADKGGGHQLLDLRVDRERHYWVSAVFFGLGAGVEIHTQASTAETGGIVVEVDFFLPEPPVNDAMAAATLAYLQAQYHTLYDEDETLMRGRQTALDQARQRADLETLWETPITDLDPLETHSVTLRGKRFCLRQHQGDWIVHSATCPHMLGPLDDAGAMSEEGVLTCPWHGYRFNARTGASLSGKCGALPKAPRLIIDEDMLSLELAS